jgi:hypothetical protein
VQANLSHFCGRVGPFWREARSFSLGGFGPWSIFAGSNVDLFGRVRSILAGSLLRKSLYVGIQCKQTDGRH